jgi:hypothetical protein
MNETCPHCRTLIPAGATVCAGCGAEKRTGPPQNVLTEWLIVCAVLGAVAGYFLVRTTSGVGPGLVIGGIVGAGITYWRYQGTRWVRVSKIAR